MYEELAGLDKNSSNDCEKAANIVWGRRRKAYDPHMPIAMDEHMAKGKKVLEIYEAGRQSAKRASASDWLL